MNATRSICSLPQGATYDEMDSPVGILTIITSKTGLHAIVWDNDRMNPMCEKIISSLIRSQNEQTMIQTKKQLTEYFEERRKTFDLPLVLNGTKFQIQAWNQLMKIP